MSFTSKIATNADIGEDGRRRSDRRHLLGRKAKRPDETVYFTHHTKKENENVAKAAGVLHLHKSSLKKEFRLNEADFKECAA